MSGLVILQTLFSARSPAMQHFPHVEDDGFAVVTLRTLHGVGSVLRYDPSMTSGRKRSYEYDHEYDLLVIALGLASFVASLLLRAADLCTCHVEVAEHEKTACVFPGNYMQIHWAAERSLTSVVNVSLWSI